MKKHCSFHSEYRSTCAYCRNLNPGSSHLDELYPKREIDDDGTSVMATVAAVDEVSDAFTPSTPDTSSAFDAAPDTSSFDSGFGGDCGGSGASGDFEMAKGVHRRQWMCDDHWALDLAQSAATIGEPFFGCKDRIFCPKCLTQITDDPGYGLAYGGIGTYWVCENDGCDWFFKQMDTDDN